MMRTAFPLLACLALAACGKDAPPPPSGDDDARRAAGDVLGGEISDAMIPLDTVTSAAPKMQDKGSASSTSGAPEPERAAPAVSRETATTAEPEPAAASEPAAAADEDG